VNLNSDASFISTTGIRAPFGGRTLTMATRSPFHFSELVAQADIIMLGSTRAPLIDRAAAEPSAHSRD
jgi:hypothetical protein